MVDEVVARLADRADAALAAARLGDRAGFATLVRCTQREVWQFVAHLVDRDSADDLTQDTYLRALGALPSYRGQASARTWLLAIARRAAADELRARRRRRTFHARLRGEAGVARARDPDVAEHTALSILVHGLDADRRAAFVLTQLLGLSYAEAAVVCGCPIGTIRSRVARARTELVAHLVDRLPVMPESAAVRRQRRSG